MEEDKNNPPKITGSQKGRPPVNTNNPRSGLLFPQENEKKGNTSDTPRQKFVSPFIAVDKNGKPATAPPKASCGILDELYDYFQFCKDQGIDMFNIPQEIALSKYEEHAAREAKKLAKQNANKPTGDSDAGASVADGKPDTDQKKGKPKISNFTYLPSAEEIDKAEDKKIQETLALFRKFQQEKANKTVPEKVEPNIAKVEVGKNLTVTDVVSTLKEIVCVAKDVENVTAKVQAMDVKKDGETEKSKAELRKERRMKQDAQRAAKQVTQNVAAKGEHGPPKQAIETPKEVEKKEESPKPKSSEKPKTKSQKLNWFQHLGAKHDAEYLRQISVTSNLHPAIVKLGVKFSSRVIVGSNARCVALLDALKKMVRDYSLPPKTEFARGLEVQLAASLSFLWGLRPPAAAQINALKHFRYQLAQLPNNVDEFDAKKKLEEEIDRYIREQIDMAGEAISIAVRNKISNGDDILTYECSSLIERILRDAHAAGVQFRVVVVGQRVGRAPEMRRRLVAAGVPCVYADLSALHFVMKTMNKVLLGASALLASGSVLGAAGTLSVAQAAREHNVPVLVACETHKFCERVQTDAFEYNEIGDPHALINTFDGNSPLQNWSSNPHLDLLNLTYDVTPPSLVTAVVTELAILPCTSAPVVLRFKSSEYGM